MNRKKILVVDDDVVVANGLSRKLKDGGYDVLIAIDGSEAVSTVRKERPDLVILDITFPPDVAHGGGVAWDGFLIIQWLRRLEEGKPLFDLVCGDPQFQAPGRDVQFDLVAGTHGIQRPAHRGLRRNVQHHRSEACPAHARVADAHHVIDIAIQ